MCGIAGIWFNNHPNNGHELIKKMTNAIQHRGPDGEGFLALDNERLFLGHRRLSVIDLTGSGKQPMMYLNKYTITYNGEIYNYIEIKEELKTKGYDFSTQTDTEVIMAAYDYWGVNCLQKFDGMFSFAIFNNETKELFCARDRLGEKPFHYYKGNNFFAFASEMKSLWEINIEKSIDEYSLYLFINMDLHEDPEDKTRTFYKSIKRLKPGHYIKFKKDEPINQIPYWNLKITSDENYPSFEQACNIFRTLFETSVYRRLRSDVSVGTSLSGGIDSTCVTLSMNYLKPYNLIQSCFSARFNDNFLDEGYFIHKAIENKNINLFETWVDEDKLINNLENIIYYQEEPFSSASIVAQWEVFRLAKEHNVTVLLDGQCADEILAGYTHFFKPFFREIYLTFGKEALKKEHVAYQTNNIVSKPIDIGFLFIAETLMPNLFKTTKKLKRLLFGVSAVKEIHPEFHASFKHKPPPFIQFQDLNSALYFYTTISGLDKLLRFSDRNSMAHSREVRLPFLSHNLVEFLFSLPSTYKIRNGWTKALLRYSLQDILPPEITWRKNKLGFQPPQNKWEQSKAFVDFANDFRNIAIKEKFISPHSPLNWKSMMVGLFIHIQKTR